MNSGKHRTSNIEPRTSNAFTRGRSLRCSAFDVRCSMFLLFLTLLSCTAPHPSDHDADYAARPSEAHYAHLFGQRYRTTVDLYLFEFVNDAEYRYLGRNGGN